MDDGSVGKVEAGRVALAGEFLRFVVVRGICAVFSYGCYLLLLIYTPYWLAYTLSFVAGLILAYVVNSKFVFRAPMRKRAAMRFPLVYIFQFFASLVVLKVAVDSLGIPASFALAVSIGVTIPFTFIFSRWIIRAG
jgi:putative flippase GtrA